MTRTFSVALATVLSCLALLSLGVGTAAATHTSGAGPSKDLVAGTGQISIFFAGFEISAQLHLNASSGPSGENPSGYFYAKLEGLFDGTLTGSVTCLGVDNHRAVVGGAVETSTIGALLPGIGILAYGRDRGEGNDPNDSVLGLPQGLPVTDCSGNPGTGVRLLQGNFIVHDAQP